MKHKTINADDFATILGKQELSDHAVRASAEKLREAVDASVLEMMVEEAGVSPETSEKEAAIEREISMEEAMEEDIAVTKEDERIALGYLTPKLYKKDSRGCTRIWWSEVIEDTAGGYDVQSNSGILAGTIKESSTAAKPSKTMTSKEVAMSKMKTSLDKKLKSGYFKTEEEARAYKPDKLMLLQRWDKFSDKVTYPCFVQPKLDGVCAGYMDTEDPHFKSRDNNRFEKLDFLAQRIHAFLDAVSGTPRTRVDSHGEIYAHGRKVSEIIEGMKGSNTEVLKELQFHPFDYMDCDADETHYSQRLTIGAKDYGWEHGPLCPFQPIRTLVAKDAKEVKAHYEKFITLGFEGAVVCNVRGFYEYDKRTYNKLKYKNLFSEEFEIVGTMTELNDGLELIMFKCKTEAGLVFKVRPAWTHEHRAEALAKTVSGDISFLGKSATVEFRSVTKYGTPFHPVLVAVRDYE